MDDIESTTDSTESSPANGISTQVEVKTVDKPAKPWIVAGFKSRAEMRAAKAKEAKDKVYAEGMGAIREKMASKEKPVQAKKKAAVKAKPASAKKPAKKKAAVKAKVKAKTKQPAKAKKQVKSKMKAKSTVKAKSTAQDKRKAPAAPKKGMVKDGSQESVALSELRPRCKKVFLAMKKGATAMLSDIVDKAFPNLPHAKASSWTRNQLRFLRIHGMVKLLGEGRYKRVA